MAADVSNIDSEPLKQMEFSGAEEQLDGGEQLQNQTASLNC
jgi:hypothetical protein